MAIFNCVVLIQLQDGNIKMFGFKFIIVTFFPHNPPIVFLDEPQNPNLVEFFDYITLGNKISCQYIDDWRKNYSKNPVEYTL